MNLGNLKGIDEVDIRALAAKGINPSTIVGETADEVADDFDLDGNEYDAVRWLQQHLWYQWSDDPDMWFPSEGNRKSTIPPELETSDYGNVIVGTDVEGLLDVWVALEY